MNFESAKDQLTKVLVTEEQIKSRVAELAAEIDK
ncbi:MAG: hypothetical protein RL243_565 [Actinomycetota bacterium]